MIKGELNQRSGFQFEIIKLNLVANAALMSFAIANDSWRCVLIACPFISFILFSLWLVSVYQRKRKESLTSRICSKLNSSSLDSLTKT